MNLNGHCDNVLVGFVMTWISSVFKEDTSKNKKNTISKCKKQKTMIGYLEDKDTPENTIIV